ncbi:hypothetical protein ACJMK2_005908 [Sinanodonta woodiana]|uniref:RBR-type E3 ubiquitin transferase n=1 Tax=Sinanodonta woodiana TaxID=1069815 RepID=A0ABD3VRJ1_SINWO
MAEGGIEVDNYEAGNLQDQNDEILALVAIFDGDENNRLQILTSASDQDEDGEKYGQCNSLQIDVQVKMKVSFMKVDVSLPVEDAENNHQPHGHTSTEGVTLARSISGQRLLWSFEAEYLTPLTLHLTLPSSYPSTDPPIFALYCPWLSSRQLATLCHELDCLWEEGGGMPILYTWIDWLQEKTLSCLGIEHSLCISVDTFDEDVDDPRVHIESLDINEIITMLLRYDRHQRNQAFQKTIHECGVCLEKYLGSHFYTIPHCNHQICHECMKACCELHVREGTVLDLQCPNFKCKSSIPPYIIKNVLTPQEFHRYETLSLQKGLEVMGDIVWCPRCKNPVIMEPEEQLSLACCTICTYSFCTDCLESWHQGEECKSKLQMLENAKRKMEERKNQKEEDALEHRRKLKLLADEYENQMYIKTKTKRCPTCVAPIVKISGCNKVICTNCMSPLCWVCERKINGYDHFVDSIRCSTFSLNDDDDDPDVNLYPRMQPIQPARLPRIEQKAILRDIKLAEQDPERQNDLVVCPGCKQRNLREKKNNHMKCWNCNTNFCFSCKQRLKGTISSHFTGGSTCRQHGQ